ncbi:MAG: hypothetical protein HY403_07825 [Elusimicrobia bacterium]|nr:hypothetical protein [Elusimicrobiota bacterium]
MLRQLQQLNQFGNERIRAQLEFQKSVVDLICAMEQSGGSSSSSSSTSSRAPAGYVPRNGYDTDLEDRYCDVDGSSAACCQQKQLSRDYYRRKGNFDIVELDESYLERHCRPGTQVRQDQGGNVPPLTESGGNTGGSVDWNNNCIRLKPHKIIVRERGVGEVTYENACSYDIMMAICYERTIDWECPATHYLAAGGSHTMGLAAAKFQANGTLNFRRLACRDNQACKTAIWRYHTDSLKPLSAIYRR